MATCFLFAQHLTNEGCLSLRLDKDGLLDFALEQRPFEAIKELQVNAQTIVVLPTEHTSLHHLPLPWLSDAKARAALPYALEEQIAQHVTTIHVAFDQHHYQNKHYLAVVCDKFYLQQLMERLNKASLDFDAITIDWFALQDENVVRSETSFLIKDILFNGALSSSLMSTYLTQRPVPTPMLTFNDTSSELPHLETSITSINTSFYVWCAQRLMNSRFINLCQGELRHRAQHSMKTRWKYAIVILLGFWFFSVIAMNALLLHQLNKNIVYLDEQLSVVYHKFFPTAKTVISPRFRVEQLLKEGQAEPDQALWIIEDILAGAMGQGGFIIEQLRFQNKNLTVSLKIADFAALEALQRRLQQSGLHVTQTQAASFEQQVKATLELGL